MSTDLEVALADVPVVAIVRSRTGEHLDAVVDCLVEAGIRAVEVTLPTPGALATIARAAQRYGDIVAVGAGTVTAIDELDAVVAAGAAFAVSPHTDSELVAEARRRGLQTLPGAQTPTEAMTAVRAGSRLVKIFPARSLGPSYVADVLAPLPDLRLVPVGGVGLADVPGYLAAGAVAVGVGSPLIGDAVESGDTATLRDRATSYVVAGRGGA